MEPEPHFEDFRSLRRKIFEWDGENCAIGRTASCSMLYQLQHDLCPSSCRIDSMFAVKVLDTQQPSSSHPAKGMAL